MAVNAKTKKERPQYPPPIFGDGSAAPDSVEYAGYIRSQALDYLYRYESRREEIARYVVFLREHELYKKLQREDGRYFKSWTDFCLTPQPYGLPCHPALIMTLLEEVDPVGAVKLAWLEASQEERQQFLAFIEEKAPAVQGSPPTHSVVFHDHLLFWIDARGDRWCADCHPVKGAA